MRTVAGGARFKPRRPPPPATPHLASPQATAADDDPRRRSCLTRGTEPTRAGVVPATTGRPQRGSHRVEDPRRLAPPPSGHPETGGGATGRVCQTRHAGAGAQAQAGGPEAQSPRRQTPRETVSALTWWQKRPISGDKMTAPDSGAHPRLAGRDLGTLAPPPVPSTTPETPGPELSGVIWSTGGGRGAKGAPGGRGGGADAKGEGAGRGRPPPSHARVGVPVRPSLRAGVWLRVAREKNEERPAGEAPPTRRAGPHEGPRPGPQTVLSVAPRTARAGP